MKYAIIQQGGKQYKVEEKEVILIDKVDAATGSKFEFKEVLFVRDGDNVQIGAPYLNNYKVVAEVLGDEKGEKIYISKFKAKANYRRRIGFRSQNTKMKIKSIGQGSASSKEIKKEKKKPVKTG